MKPSLYFYPNGGLEMHLIYLKSIDAHINLDRVAAVHHNVTNYNGQACTQVWFAAPDSQNENRLATIID